MARSTVVCLALLGLAACSHHAKPAAQPEPTPQARALPAPPAREARPATELLTRSEADGPTEPPPPPRDEAVPPQPPDPGDEVGLLASVLGQPERLLARRDRYARAVLAISTQMGKPITMEQALADNPCGGWSGPDCSNLTVGLEASKIAVPLIARLYGDEDAGRFLDLLVEAVSIHSVWHDAYGYVYSKLHAGEGYIYAGCRLSPCEPGNPLAGQVEGIVYQMGRLVGVLHTPECGESCTLAPI